MGIHVNIKRVSPLKRDTVTTDGTEQTIVEFFGLGIILGHVDLTNMQVGDIIILREYIKISITGEYVKYAEESYNGVQVLPAIYVTPKLTDIALKVTIQQTAGLSRDFDYNFLKEV